MGTLVQPATSLQFVQQEITATLNGSAYDPSGDTVVMAFIPAPATGGAPPNPAPGQWNVGSWETDPGPVYWAQCLVGPGGTVQLAQGEYVIAVQVTDNPEIPVIWGWFLTIT